jgi:hypothetical protein
LEKERESKRRDVTFLSECKERKTHWRERERERAR